MVASELIDGFSTWIKGNAGIPIDTSDRLNMVTMMFFMVFASLIAAKQYLFNAMSCYIANTPSGSKFDDYLTDYCWVHGTIPFRAHEKMPQTAEEWDVYDNHRRINYYQWVPFVLGLQCIFFYVPHIAWQAICSQRAGGDLFSLVQSASSAATKSRDARQGDVAQVAEFLEDMLNTHKSCARHNKRAQMADRAYKTCGLCVVSKRLGTSLVVSYLLIKVLTIINAGIQIYLIQYFLGFYEGGSYSKASMRLGLTPPQQQHPMQQNQNYMNPNIMNQQNMLNNEIMPYGDDNLSGYGFGLTVANYIRTGRDWPETLIFPRVAYCRVPGIRLVGGDNAYTAQCALPINMLNEKIYIFLWFWIVFVLCVSIGSLIVWLMRLVFDPKRKNFIKRFLRTKRVLNSKGQLMSRHDIDGFVDEYLRRDGVFLIKMMTINAGEVITAEVVQKLYMDYIEDHADESESSFVHDEKPPLMRSLDLSKKPEVPLSGKGLFPRDAELV